MQKNYVNVFESTIYIDRGESSKAEAEAEAN